MVVLNSDSSDKSSSAVLADIMLDKMVASNQLEFMYKTEVREALLRRHKHQYENKSHKDSTFSGSNSQGGFLSAVRSISDIGKSFSHGRNLDKHKNEEGMRVHLTRM